MTFYVNADGLFPAKKCLCQKVNENGVILFCILTSQFFFSFIRRVIYFKMLGVTLIRNSIQMFEFTLLLG